MQNSRPFGRLLYGFIIFFCKSKKLCFFVFDLFVYDSIQKLLQKGTHFGAGGNAGANKVAAVYRKIFKGKTFFAFYYFFCNAAKFIKIALWVAKFRLFAHIVRLHQVDKVKKSGFAKSVEKALYCFGFRFKAVFVMKNKGGDGLFCSVIEFKAGKDFCGNLSTGRGVTEKVPGAVFVNGKAFWLCNIVQKRRKAKVRYRRNGTHHRGSVAKSIFIVAEMVLVKAGEHGKFRNEHGNNVRVFQKHLFGKIPAKEF